VEEILGKNSITPMVGDTGSAIFTDTSRCFHAGSREAKKPRNVVIIQYLSPFAFHYPILNMNKVAPFSKIAKGKSFLTRLALGYHN
jgi:hypothetical protein